MKTAGFDAGSLLINPKICKSGFDPLKTSILQKNKIYQVKSCFQIS